MQFIKAKKSDAKALVIWAFTALKRHASGNLHAGSGKFAAILDHIIIGKANHNAGGLKPFRRNRTKAATFQQLANFGTKRDLLITHLCKAIFLCFKQGITEHRQRVGWHGRVIGMTAIFISLHDRVPFFDVTNIAAGFGLTHPGYCRLGQHDKTATW